MSIEPWHSSGLLRGGSYYVRVHVWESKLVVVIFVETLRGQVQTRDS